MSHLLRLPILRAAFACAALSLTACSASTADPFPPVPTGNTTIVAPADPDHFEFVVTGDNRSTGHGYPMPPCFDEICSEIGIVHPPFVMWTGDVIEGYGDTPAEANAEYDVFIKGLQMTGVPVYNAPGNHEFSLDPSLLPVYKSRIGELYGSFDYGNSHFVVLNSNAVDANGVVKAGGGSLDDAQWAWLENDLKSTSAKNIFVFLHHYPFGPPDPDTPASSSGWISDADRDKFHAMMVKYGVRAVFAGHNHIYWHQAKDGVDYYISGGAGAPMDASPDQGGFLHYIVVHVDGNKIATDILQPWHLLATYPSADGGATETVLVDNTNHMPVSVNGLLFRVAAPTGAPLAVVATVSYKGKSVKPAEAHIISQTPSADGKSVTVVVEATAKSARTTEVTVGPASAVQAQAGN